MANNTLFDGDAYWNDSWVQELDGDEERLYHFYITSPNLDKSGVYKQTERSVEFFVRGLGIEKIREITEKFAKVKKVIRCGEWIIVPTSLKHQNYKNLPKVIASITEYLRNLPDEVFEALRECDYPLDLNAIRPPKEVKSDRLSEKTDSLPIDYAKSIDRLSEKTDSLPVYKAEFNSIESNLIESNKEFVVVDQEDPSSRGEEPPGGNQTTTTNFSNIQETAKALGFFLSGKQAGAFHCLDPTWLSGGHSFLAFAAEKARGDPSKSHGDQERIFAKAWGYQNLLGEFPEWRAGRERIALAEAREAAVEKARRDLPPRCPGCGGELVSPVCRSCGGRLEFDGGIPGYIFHPPDGKSLSEEFSEAIKRKRGGG